MPGMLPMCCTHCWQDGTMHGDDSDIQSDNAAVRGAPAPVPPPPTKGKKRVRRNKADEL